MLLILSNQDKAQAFLSLPFEYLARLSGLPDTRQPVQRLPTHFRLLARSIRHCWKYLFALWTGDSLKKGAD